MIFKLAFLIIVRIICGLSNDLNGTENNLIWKEGAGGGDEPAVVLPEEMMNYNKSAILNKVIYDVNC